MFEAGFPGPAVGEGPVFEVLGDDALFPGAVDQEAGVFVVVEAEVQIVMDAVEVFDGGAPAEEVGGGGGVDVFGEFVADGYVLVVGLGFVAQLVGGGAFVVL